MRPERAHPARHARSEADIRSGTSDVYNHEMPGGQYANLREQAPAMGLEHPWPEVSTAYADVNILFCDIVKVTPPSKVLEHKVLRGQPRALRAPMPGMVVTVAVKVGQKVAKGDPLLSMEAMKMEAMLSAERDAMVTAVHVRPGMSSTQRIC